MANILSEIRLYICNNIINRIPSHRARLLFYRKIMQFDIAKNASILMNCKFDSAGNLYLGENSVINGNCRIDTRALIHIGKNVSISENVILLTADHDMDSFDMRGRTRSVTIDDFCWLGTRAMILPGVVIGRGAVIASGAVVSKNVAPADVVGGIPAKIIKKRLSKEYLYSTSYRRLFQ